MTTSTCIATLTPFAILRELINGDSQYDIANEIGSQCDPQTLAKAEDIYALTSNSTEAEVMDALDWLIDGNSAHDLANKIGNSSCEDDVEKAQSFIDTYEAQIR